MKKIMLYLIICLFVVFLLMTACSNNKQENSFDATSIIESDPVDNTSPEASPEVSVPPAQNETVLYYEYSHLDSTEIVGPFLSGLDELLSVGDASSTHYSCCGYEGSLMHAVCHLGLDNDVKFLVAIDFDAESLENKEEGFKFLYDRGFADEEAFPYSTYEKDGKGYDKVGYASLALIKELQNNTQFGTYIVWLRDPNGENPWIYTGSEKQ